MAEMASKAETGGKTLFVSDLDGTLLQPGAVLSDRTVGILNKCIEAGMEFTVATARTPATVAAILEDVSMQLPAIVMTGASMWDIRTGTYTDVKYIPEEGVKALVDLYRRRNTSSFLFTLEDDLIDIYLTGGTLNELQREFMEERRESPFKRFHISENGDSVLPPDLSKTVLLYTMIPDAEAAATFAESRLVPGVRAQYYHDIYGPETGILEAFSARATKANAVRELARRTGAVRTVCFGDNLNDIPMMEAATLSVAVGNALPEVKERADMVIGPNTEDSVARFMEEVYFHGFDSIYI